MQNPIFYGHWRHMLKIARDLATTSACRESDKLSNHFASIILSRTCLETYFNELYFLQIHEGTISERSTYYSHMREKRCKLSHKNFVDLHICERLEVSHPNPKSTLIADVSLQNQIRNYCIHYTASDVKRQLSLEFNAHPNFNDAKLQGADSPQELYINEKSALWCNAVTLQTVISVEEGQQRAHSNSEINIAHCLDMLN